MILSPVIPTQVIKVFPEFAKNLLDNLPSAMRHDHEVPFTCMSLHPLLCVDHSCFETVPVDTVQIVFKGRVD